MCRGPNWEDKGGSSSTSGKMANGLTDEPVEKVDPIILQNARRIPSPVVSEGIDAFRCRLKVEGVEPSRGDPRTLNVEAKRSMVWGPKRPSTFA